jgi:hypothetical protein
MPLCGLAIIWRRFIFTDKIYYQYGVLQAPSGGFPPFTPEVAEDKKFLKIKRLG